MSVVSSMFFSDDMDVLQLSVTHYNNELGEVVEYEMLDPPMFG